ncbi:MAG: polymer-forming cytoskeletal protein [Terriglobales bacterium]
MWTSTDSTSNPQQPRGEQQKHQGGSALPAGGETAYIGKSLLIKGEVSGSEPIHIEGRIEGSISLPGGHVSVGREGVVTSSVQAGEVIVRGTLQGNITASDRVEIHRGGNVIGEVVTQRISIEDGAQMKGSIKMGRPDPKAHLEIHGDNGTRAAVEHSTPVEEHPMPAALTTN